MLRFSDWRGVDLWGSRVWRDRYEAQILCKSEGREHTSAPQEVCSSLACSSILLLSLTSLGISRAKLFSVSRNVQCGFSLGCYGEVWHHGIQEKEDLRGLMDLEISSLVSIWGWYTMFWLRDFYKTKTCSSAITLEMNEDRNLNSSNVCGVIDIGRASVCQCEGPWWAETNAIILQEKDAENRPFIPFSEPHRFLRHL